jgi:hypothetical protein
LPDRKFIYFSYLFVYDRKFIYFSYLFVCVSDQAYLT